MRMCIYSKTNERKKVERALDQPQSLSFKKLSSVNVRAMYSRSKNYLTDHSESMSSRIDIFVYFWGFI